MKKKRNEEKRTIFVPSNLLREIENLRQQLANPTPANPDDFLLRILQMGVREIRKSCLETEKRESVQMSKETEVTRVIKIPMPLLLRLERLRRIYGTPKGDGVLIRALELGLKELENQDNEDVRN